MLAYEPVLSVANDVQEPPAWTSLDLAYTYVETKTNRFECAGLLLGLPCDVEVERIVLPAKAYRLLLREESKRPRAGG